MTFEYAPELRLGFTRDEALVLSQQTVHPRVLCNAGETAIVKDALSRFSCLYNCEGGPGQRLWLPGAMAPILKRAFEDYRDDPHGDIQLGLMTAYRMPSDSLDYTYSLLQLGMVEMAIDTLDAALNNEQPVQIVASPAQVIGAMAVAGEQRLALWTSADQAE